MQNQNFFQTTKAPFPLPRPAAVRRGRLVNPTPFHGPLPICPAPKTALLSAQFKTVKKTCLAATQSLDAGNPVWTNPESGVAMSASIIPDVSWGSPGVYARAVFWCGCFLVVILFSGTYTIRVALTSNPTVIFGEVDVAVSFPTAVRCGVCDLV